MDSRRWEQIQALFHKAADLPDSERRDYVQAASANDSELLNAVLALLDEDARPSTPLDRDVADLANQVLESAVAPGTALELGPYKIGRLLGEGGMGVVYLAERADLGNRVAIKFLRDAWMSPARRERFALEQRTLAQLNHPSIARLYDADTLGDGTPWFVMEYVDGIPLTDYCREHRCTLDERLRLFRSVCEAVHYAHQHAVIHRDLKPSNILVKADGTARLLDFGISKHLASFDKPIDQTRTGVRLMTPAYAAPEQIRGEGVGIFTDIYSLGVILYELFTGHHPLGLSNETPVDPGKLILERTPEKPSAAAARSHDANTLIGLAGRTAWADLDVLCLTAMHKDPQRRYQSVEALIRDIDHYLRGEPLEARPDHFGYKFGKFIKRNSRAVSAGVFVFTMVVALVIFFTVRLANARDAALTSAARTQRIQRFMLSLFEGGEREVGPSENLRVVTLLDQGVREAESLNAEPGVQAELYQTLGNLYQKLGKFDRADSLLQSALERRKSLYGAQHSEVVASLVALGLLRTDEGRYDEGERLVREGLTVSKLLRPRADSRIAEATAALGRVLQIRGSYQQALPVLKEALLLYATPGLPTREYQEVLGDLANSHYYLGHFSEAQTLFEQALATDRQLYGERHPSVAVDLIDLGAMQFERAHYSEAERYYRQGVEIMQAWFGHDHPKTANALGMLGRSLRFQGRLAEAEEIHRQNLTVLKRFYGADHPRVANTLNDLGSIEFDRGKLDDAEASFLLAASIYKKAYGEQHYLNGLAIANLASVHMKRTEYAQAESLFLSAIEVFKKTLPADHPNIGVARVKLGHTLLLQKRYREAESHSVEGYNILTKGKMSPTANWLQQACEDLIQIYTALDKPERVGEFRTALSRNKSAPSK